MFLLKFYKQKNVQSMKAEWLWDILFLALKGIDK